MVQMIWISLILFCFSGLFRAAYSTRIFHAFDSRLFRWFPAQWDAYYVGGTSHGYNQSLPWTCDFAHLMIFLELWSSSLGGLLLGVGAFQESLWLLLLIPVMWSAEGWVFTFFFHYVWQPTPDGSFIHFLRRVLRPWR